MNVLWSIVWLLILIFISWWVAMFCAFIYIIVSCFVPCLPALEEFSSLLMKGINLCMTCVRNVLSGSPLC